MRKAVLLASAAIGLAGCPSPPPPQQPAPIVTIWYREPFDWTNYNDSSGKTESISTAIGDIIPYIAILCITNQSTSTFNFYPANVYVYLGQSNGAPGTSEAIYAPLLTFSSGPFIGFGDQYWQPPSSLGMGQAVVPGAIAGVPGTFVAPASFTAVTKGSDNDPADQPGTSIPGNSNAVMGHTLEYCAAGLAPGSAPGTCANFSGLTINFNRLQDGYPRYLNTAQAADFESAEVVSQQPPQNLPPPSCP